MGREGTNPLASTTRHNTMTLDTMRDFAATLPTLNGLKPWQAYNWGADTYLIQASKSVGFTVKKTIHGWEVKQDWWLPQGGRVHTVGFKKVGDFEGLCANVRRAIKMDDFLFENN